MPSFLKLTTLALSGLSFAALVAGCAADATPEGDDDSVASEDAFRTGIEPGTWKLYAEPRHQPNPGCDVHTSLTLGNRYGARAELREALDGFCEIYVEPQERSYRLRLAGTSCGSKIYEGKKRIGGKLRTIKIVDHRTRMCRDLVPARIIVEETDRNGDVQTKYSFDGAPAPSTSTWLTLGPKQCGDNPWQNGSQTADEAGQVKSYFSSQGIQLEAVGFAYPGEPRMVCMACSCPRGDTLVVKAKDAADAQKLVSQHGFAEATNAFTKSPTQCGTNPWENGQQTQDSRLESQRLASWAKGAGAPLSEAGFIDYTEPRMVCMACSCPRGDIAIAFPESAAAGNELENLGWTRVEN